MVSHHFFSQLVLCALIWLFIMLHRTRPKRPVTAPAATVLPEPLTPKRPHPNEPKPFEGLTHKPHCALCERDTASPTAPPPGPPDPMAPTNRRPRAVDVSMPLCPHGEWDDRGGLGRGNLRANGPPSGGPWRQFHWTSGPRDFWETHGTIFPGTQATVELIGRVLACLAQGGGLRATARVFEGDAHTVLHWLGEAAAPRRAFSSSFLCALPLEPVQLDELAAVRRDLKAGASSDDEAIKRLERAPSWVWTVMDPKRKWLGAVDVGSRTLALAQRVVHQVPQRLAPGCVPRFLTDGLQDYARALLTHFGHWLPPARRQAKGPMPKPRWMPLPAVLYAQGARRTGADAASASSTAWSSVLIWPSNRSSRPAAGPARPPLSSASIATSVSG